MEEYKMIRDELIDKLKTEERLIQFCYTIVLAIWIAAFTIKSEWVLLFSFLLILSLSVRVLKSKMDSTFLAAYMFVYLEPKIDIKWETNNAEYCKENFRDKELPKFHIFTNLDFMFLTIITSVLFWIMRAGNWLLLDNYIVTFLVILLQVAMIIIEGFIVKQFYRYKDFRKTYIDRWKKVLGKEANVDEIIPKL